MSFYSNVLLILEFNICMKQRTEIPSNQRGELELLFYIYWYILHILSPLTVQFSQKKKIYWPFFLRNPFIQLSFKTMVFTIHKGNSVSLPSRHNIKHVLATHLFLSNWRWHIVWLMTRTVGWGAGRATVETDKRKIRFADSINHGKHMTQNIWWPYFIIFPNQ